MAWTTIVKPSGMSWTDLPKPSATTSIITTGVSGGEPLGLLLAITVSSVTGSSSVITGNWTSLVVGTTGWTNIAKPI